MGNIIQWRMGRKEKKRTKGRRGVGEKGVISLQRIKDRVLPLFTCRRSMRMHMHME
jgi:hypothetical protein